jgi:hypothetical protein
MQDDSTYSASNSAVGVQMAVNLETKLPYFSEPTIENKSFNN